MNHHILFNRAVIHGCELRQGVEAFTHHACSALGLRSVTIDWDERVSTARIDNRGRIVLADVKDDAKINRATLVRYCGFVVHELLHRKYTVHHPGYYLDAYLSALHNAVEDAWIEHSAIDAGLLGNIDGLLSGLIDQMVTDAKAAVSDWADPRQYPFLLAVHLRRHATNKIALPTLLQPIFDKAAKKVLACKSTDDTFKLAKWIMNQLNGLPQSEPDQGQDKKKDKGQDKGDQGEQDGAADAPDGAEGDDQDEGEGEGAGQGKNAPTGHAPGQNCEPVEVEPTVAAPKGAESCGTWSAKGDITKPGSHLNYSPLWDCKVTVPAKMRYEVRRLFEDTATTLLSPNRKSGAINPRALHKFGQSDALFQLRRDIDGIDSAVVIVLDVSQSMFDNRLLIARAVAAAAALVETLSAAQVKTAIVSFGDNVSLAADFDTTAKVKIDRLTRMDSGGSTNDFSAIRYAHDMLRVRPEQRKVCFVLTDGDGNREATREQAHAGTALGITTIGIGIQHNVSSVYPQAVRVDNVADLGNVALGQIKLAA